MTAGMSYSDGRRDTEIKTAGLTPSPTRGTLLPERVCVFIHQCVIICVCDRGSSPLQATWTRGINGCHSFQRHGVLSCQGWLVAGWIQFLLLSSCSSFPHPPLLLPFLSVFSPLVPACLLIDSLSPLPFPPLLSRLCSFQTGSDKQ